MIDKRILKIPGMKSLFRKLVGISFLQVLFIIGQAISLSLLITGLFDGNTLKSQLLYIVLFAIFFMLRHVSHYISNILTGKFAAKAGSILRHKLLRKILSLGPCLVQKEGSGTLTVAAMDGVSHIEDYISILTIKIVEMMILPIGILLVVFYFDILSGITLFLVFPIIIIFMALFGLAAKAKADKQFFGYKLLSSHFIDSLQGLETLNNIGKSESHEKNVYRVSENYRKATMSTLIVAMLSTFALDFFTTLSIALVAVFLGLRLIEGKILLFPALTILLLAPEYFLPLRQFAEDYHATLNGKNALSDIDRIESMAELEKEDKLEKHNFKYTGDTIVEIKNMSFNYEENIKTLDSINLKFKGYANIGIIGYSGSGKTTLLNILGGFLQPKSGDIYVNNIKLRHLTDALWQEDVIYIPQNPYIFSGTIKENLAFYNPNATMEEILEASKKVGLHEIIDKLPNKYNTLIGEGGRMFSGGQAQRIALARAFIDKDRKILMLDEPTAHLDIETEVELKKYILELSKDKLMIFSTHRLHWMKDMDLVNVVENGKIVESGTYTELSNNPKSNYNNLAKKMRGEMYV